MLTFLCSRRDPPSSSNPTPRSQMARALLPARGWLSSLTFFDRARSRLLGDDGSISPSPVLRGRDGGGGSGGRAPAGEQGSGGSWSEGGRSGAQPVGVEGEVGQRLQRRRASSHEWAGRRASSIRLVQVLQPGTDPLSWPGVLLALEFGKRVRILKGVRSRMRLRILKFCSFPEFLLEFGNRFQCHRLLTRAIRTRSCLDNIFNI